MTTQVAESAGEHAATVIENVVESAVAQVEGALESAEARAEAAEELNETILESARRDALHDEIEELRGEIEECRELHQSDVAVLRTQNEALQLDLHSLRHQMTELASKSTVVTVSTLPPSDQPIAGTSPETPAATVVRVEPGNAAPAAIPEKVAVPAKARRWI